MTFNPPDGPLPELSTTRVASGTSARVVAVAVAGLLIGVVGFTVVSRPPAPVEPSQSAAPVAVAPTPEPTPTPPRTQLHGNDGIFGWLVVAQLSAYRVPRGPGLYNRCRWDVGPQAARPRSSHDEAGCAE